MSGMDLTGYSPATLAHDLVTLVDDALGDWDRTVTGPGLWVWRSYWEDRHQVVAVNALEDRVVVPVEGWPTKVGPTLLGGDANGLFASATLPNVADRTQIREAIRVVAVLVPDLEPATWSPR